MFIAGVPAEVGAHALNHWHLRNATSFNGCVKELHINGKLVDFLQGSYGAKGLDEHAIFNYCRPFFMVKLIILQAATMRHKVSPGCGAFAEENEVEEAKARKASDPCDRKPCRHGECSAKSTHPGFQCRCQPGFAGELCDIRGGCSR